MPYSLTKPTKRNLWSPFYPLSTSFNNVFDDFFGEVQKEIGNLIDTNSHYCLNETDDAVNIDLFIPSKNIEKSDVSVSFENSVLTVEINHNQEENKKTNIPSSSYMRYSLYDSRYNIDPDKIEAQMDGNQLKISLPKINKTKRIEVK